MTRYCPYCGSQLPPPEAGLPGLTQRCPTCAQEIDAPQAAPGSDAAPPPPPLPQCDGLASLAEQLGRAPSGHEESAAQPAAAPEAPAWEGEAGFLAGLTRTTGQMLFHPRRTMAAAGLPGQRMPLTYSLIMGTLCGAANVMWGQLLDRTPLSSEMALTVLALTPLINLLGLYLGAGVTHLMLLMVGGAKNGFNATFRVMGYANAAGVWLFIPWLGLALSLVWSLAIMVGGLSGAHGVSRGRAFWSLAAFLLLLMGLALMLSLAAGLIAALLGLSMSQKGLWGLL